MSTDADALIRRKDEHIDHVRAGRGVSQTTSGLAAVRFVHDALPDIDHDAIDLATRFLGRRVALPFLISSMTGGPSRAEAINARLAEAAQSLGVVLAVGSQRVALETDGGLGLGHRFSSGSDTASFASSSSATRSAHRVRDRCQ